MFKRFKRKSPIEVAIYCFVSFIFALVAASYLYILIWTFMSSIKTHAEIILDPFAWPEVPQWKNYREMFSIFNVNGKGFWQMLFNSIWFSVVPALISQFTVARSS